MNRFKRVEDFIIHLECMRHFLICSAACFLEQDFLEEEFLEIPNESARVRAQGKIKKFLYALMTTIRGVI
jgi:hypothetical protein